MAKFAYFTKNSVERELDMLINKRVLVVPPLLDASEPVHEFYYKLMPPDVLSKLTPIIEDTRLAAMLHWDKDPAIRIFGLGEQYDKEYKLKMDLEVAVPMHNSGWRDKSPTRIENEEYFTLSPNNPHWDRVSEFVLKFNEARQQTAKARKFTSFIMTHANTVGQLKRLWPEVVPLLGQDLQAELGDMVRSSRLPRTVDLEHPHYAFREEVSNMLALCSLVHEDVLAHKVWVE